jgi:molybdate ABC transporter, permease protein
MTSLEATATLLSLRVAAVAVLGSLPFALLAAVRLARGGRDALLLDALVHLPLVLPPVVVGYGLLVTLGTQAPLGAWLLDTFNLRLVFHWTGAALAAAVVTFPFQVRALRLALEAIDPGLLQVAQSLGLGPWARFRRVTLPLALPGLVAGAITAFAAALGEFGAIMTFAANIPGETQTLPLAIYSALQTPGGEAAAARLVSFSIALALGGLLLGEGAARQLRRRTGQALSPRH